MFKNTTEKTTEACWHFETKTHQRLYVVSYVMRCVNTRLCMWPQSKLIHRAPVANITKKYNLSLPKCGPHFGTARRVHFGEKGTVTMSSAGSMHHQVCSAREDCFLFRLSAKCAIPFCCFVICLSRCQVHIIFSFLNSYHYHSKHHYAIHAVRQGKPTH